MVASAKLERGTLSHHAESEFLRHSPAMEAMQNFLQRGVESKIRTRLRATLIIVAQEPNLVKHGLVLWCCPELV